MEREDMIIFLLFVLGVSIIFYVVLCISDELCKRKKVNTKEVKTMDYTCDNCGADVYEDDIVCPECGYYFAEDFDEVDELLETENSDDQESYDNYLNDIYA